MIPTNNCGDLSKDILPTDKIIFVEESRLYLSLIFIRG